MMANNQVASSLKVGQSLKQIVDILLLNGTLVDCSGLVHGKTGIAVFFFHYALHTGNDLFEEYAAELLAVVQSQIHSTTPVDYERGIAGIGVGVDYLIRNGFLEAEDDLFDDFDQRMYRAVMYDPWIDFSLYDGLTGYGRYWINRWNEQCRPANEAIEYILDAIEHRTTGITLKEQQDIYCFLHDLSKLSKYNSLAKRLIKKFTDTYSVISETGFLRLNKSLIEKPLNIYFGKEYFNLPIDRLTEELTVMEIPGTNEDMGLFSGHSGYSLCQLALSNTKQSDWMKLM